MQKMNKSSKPKSSRKPLKEISNANGNGNGVRQSLKPSTTKTKFSVREEPEPHRNEDGVLDRLFLVNSNLSNIIKQVDELVVEAVKAEGASTKGKKEIELFTNFLSDVHSSLKSWIPRFQNLLTDQVEYGNQLGQLSPSKTSPAANEETRSTNVTPAQSDLDSIVSPSSLVSWCAERTVESGRQLFMLTPLPRSRQVSSKLQGSSKSLFARKVSVPPSTDLDIPPLMGICVNTEGDQVEAKNMKTTPNKCSKPSATEMESNITREFVSPPKVSNRNRSMFLMTQCLKRSPPKSCVNTKGDQVEAKNMKTTPNKCSKPSATEMESNITREFVSPPKVSNRNRSMFLMTPCLKRSPPKSCVLLEPIIESRQQANNHFPKKTPSQVRSRSHTVTPYYSRFSESLPLKYADPIETKQDYKSGMGRKEIDSQSNYTVSPPKSCALMEPSDSISINNPILDERKKSLTAAPNKADQGGNPSTQQSLNEELSCLKYQECTPMWKENNTGKLPGENTLKKELWTKFEAASTNVLRLDASVLQGKSGKGFLDRLEEVCYEEMSSDHEGLR